LREGVGVSEEYDAELEALRRRRLLELQRRLLEEQRRIEMEQQIQAARKIALRQILTPEARARLTNLKMVRPELATRVEDYLIQLAQAGRIRTPVTDEQLKRLLAALAARKRDIRIRRI